MDARYIALAGLGKQTFLFYSCFRFRFDYVPLSYIAFLVWRLHYYMLQSHVCTTFAVRRTAVSGIQPRRGTEMHTISVVKFALSSGRVGLALHRTKAVLLRNRK